MFPMSVDDYYVLIADLMSRSRFNQEIKERYEMYNGLLDEDAIAYLIVDELGRNPGNKMKIRELYDGINATVEADIISVGEVEKRGNYRILKVLIGDETGRCHLVLWNDEIDSAIKDLKNASKVKIINGYVKENMYGLQITLGKWGILVTE
jgi:ssDNA-binding replication factor A large subunit